MTNFEFLKSDYPKLYLLAELAEKSIWGDPANTLTKLRILSEKITLYLLEFEGVEDFDQLTQRDRLAKLQRDTDFPKEIFDSLHEIRKSGNKASHDNHGTSAEAKFMLRRTFYLSVWFYELYDGEVNATYAVPVQEEVITQQDLSVLELKLKESETQKAEFERKLAELVAQSEGQKEERKQRKQRPLRKSEETEAETRERIDKQLRDAGWICDTDTYNYKSKRTLPSKGKSIALLNGNVVKSGRTMPCLSIPS
jgi:type I restriction enzyme R subunit